MERISDEDSRKRILAAATKLFAQKGFDGTGIREICRGAAVNICMISYYFGGKKGLYDGIIEDLIERQTEYAKTFTDISKDPSSCSKQEQMALLMLVLDRFVDFFYTKISKDLITLLLKEQQSGHFIEKAPAMNFLRKLTASIFEKDENDREMIFKTFFIMCQINSPRILPALTLHRLGQDDFTNEDIKIIKENVKFYVKASLREAGID